MKLKNSSQQFNKRAQVKQKKDVYVVDFLNIFSDYREMKYLKLNVDFHKVKHENIVADTFAFFEMFFGIYLKTLNINKNTRFIFVLKNIAEYTVLLPQILEKYINIDLRFITISNKFSEIDLDKNKDDFLCQYFYYLLSQDSSVNCNLISNDLYRDRINYTSKFNKIPLNLDILRIELGNKIDTQKATFEVNEKLLPFVIEGKYNRQNIPKFELLKLL